MVDFGESSLLERYHCDLPGSGGSFMGVQMYKAQCFVFMSIENVHMGDIKY